MFPGLAPGILIARVPFTASGGQLLPGDRFDPSAHDMPQHHIDTMVEQGIHVVPLTAKSYAGAMMRRDPGTIGAGFTHEELVAMKIVVDPKDAPPPPAAEPAAWTAPEGSMIYRGFVLCPLQRARLLNWEVRNADGKLLRDKPCANIERAQAYVDALIAQAQVQSTADEGSAIAESEVSEDDDDGELQSGAEQPS